MWLLLLGRVAGLHPKAGSDVTRPSPCVQDVADSADRKDKKHQEWGKGRVHEVMGGWGRCPRPHKKFVAGRGTGRWRLWRVCADFSASSQSSCQGNAMWIINCHPSVPSLWHFHSSAPGRACLQLTWLRKRKIFYAKWYSALFCTMQEISKHLAKSEATGSHLVMPSGCIWYLAKPTPLRLLTYPAQNRHK